MTSNTFYTVGGNEKKRGKTNYHPRTKDAKPSMFNKQSERIIRKPLTDDDIKKKNELAIIVSSLSNIEKNIKQQKDSDKAKYIEQLYFTACKLGYVESVKLLVGNYKVDPNNCADDKKYTGLHKASFGGHHELVAYFLSCDVELKVNLQKETPYDACVIALKKASANTSTTRQYADTTNLQKCIDLFSKYPPIIELNFNKVKNDLRSKLNMVSGENYNQVSLSLKKILDTNQKRYDDLLQFLCATIISSIEITSISDRNGQNIKPVMAMLCVTLMTEDKFGKCLYEIINKKLTTNLKEEKTNSDLILHSTNLILFMGNILGKYEIEDQNDFVIEYFKKNCLEIFGKFKEFLVEPMAMLLTETFDFFDSTKICKSTYKLLLETFSKVLTTMELSGYNKNIMKNFITSLVGTKYESVFDDITEKLVS